MTFERGILYQETSLKGVATRSMGVSRVKNSPSTVLPTKINPLSKNAEFGPELIPAKLVGLPLTALPEPRMEAVPVATLLEVVVEVKTDQLMFTLDIAVLVPVEILPKTSR
jgi:hypothetical protein